jgi:hypothetical protein
MSAPAAANNVATVPALTTMCQHSSAESLGRIIRQSTDIAPPQMLIRDAREREQAAVHNGQARAQICGSVSSAAHRTGAPNVTDEHRQARQIGTSVCAVAT